MNIDDYVYALYTDEVWDKLLVKIVKYERHVMDHVCVVEFRSGYIEEVRDMEKLKLLTESEAMFYKLSN